MEPRHTLIRLQGHLHFRNRLVLSLLSGKPIRISKIRPDADNPGITDYEKALIDLMVAISNGTRVELPLTGTSVTFVPGTLVNGEVEMDMPTTRPMGYFLEALVAVAPFGKKPLVCTLSGGVTNSDHRGDISPDLLRTATLPYLAEAFGLDAAGLQLKVIKRGAAPLGGGQVQLIIQPATRLHPCRQTEPGRVLKIRGIASCTRVSPNLATRLANGARSMLTRYIPDVYVVADAARKHTNGNSPGLSLVLVAESTTKVRYVAEVSSRCRVLDCPSNAPLIDPDVLADRCVRGLLENIKAAGCVDVAHQWLTFLYATVCSDDVSKWVQVARGEHGLHESTIQTLRDLYTFFNVQFNINQAEDGMIAISGVGAGFHSIHRKFT